MMLAKLQQENCALSQWQYFQSHNMFVILKVFLPSSFSKRHANGRLLWQSPILVHILSVSLTCTYWSVSITIAYKVRAYKNSQPISTEIAGLLHSALADLLFDSITDFDGEAALSVVGCASLHQHAVASVVDLWERRALLGESGPGRLAMLAVSKLEAERIMVGQGHRQTQESTILLLVVLLEFSVVIVDLDLALDDTEGEDTKDVYRVWSVDRDIMAIAPYATPHSALKAKLEIFDPAPVLRLRVGMQKEPAVVIVESRKLDIEEGEDLVDDAADAVKILRQPGNVCRNSGASSISVAALILRSRLARSESGS